MLVGHQWMFGLVGYTTAKSILAHLEAISDEQ